MDILFAERCGVSATSFVTRCVQMLLLPLPIVQSTLGLLGL